MTTTMERPIDETGGLTALMDILYEKSSAQTIITPLLTPNDVCATGTPSTSTAPAERHAPGFVRRTLTRVKAAISKAVATVREATAWLFSDIPNPKLVTRLRNRFFGYKGRHNVRVAWYGRQRSTASAVVVTRERRMRAQQTSRTKEGVLSSYFPLPEYWVSHMADLIQTIRDEHSVFHPSTGRHWECS